MPAVDAKRDQLAFGDDGEEALHGAKRVSGEVGAHDGEVGDAEQGQAVADKVAAKEHVDEVKLFVKQAGDSYCILKVNLIISSKTCLHIWRFNPNSLEFSSMVMICDARKLR